uniref:F-box domain-containing protein n=1 Tax=Strigamia maritima TaxID=126957 RepID=T1IP46_STRMM
MTSCDNKVDIHLASVQDLAILIGGGQATSGAQVGSRLSCGEFASAKGLMVVPGIRTQVLEQNHSQLACSLPGQSEETIRNVRKKIRDCRVDRLDSTSDQEDINESGMSPMRRRSSGGSDGASSSNHSMIPSSLIEQNNVLAPLHVRTIMNGLKFSDCEIEIDTSSDDTSNLTDHEIESSEGENHEQEMDLMNDLNVINASNGRNHKSECCKDENNLEDAESVDEEDRGDDCHPGDNQKVKITEKTLMKRKSEQGGEARGHTPGKKPCWSSTGCNHLSKVEEGAGDHNAEELEKLTLTPKKRILLAKNIPPHDLGQWLTMFQTWSHEDRLMAIDHLIDTCEPTQVRHMMSIIEPQFQRDFISLLPKELALYVLSFLEPKDLARASQTCRVWRSLAEDNLLWREKCREAGIEVRQVFCKRRSRAGFVPSPWKTAYMRQYNIEMNWRSRPIRPPMMLKGHDDHVITCLQFSGTRIVSGSDDNTLKVWSATTGKCLRTLVGHTGGVWSSQMSGNTIVSGSTDRTLKVWNADTGYCIHTLYGHTSTVRCMHLHGVKVVSGSRDATLRLWDIQSGECLHVLVGHVAAVRCVQYDGRLVVSGAYDYMVKVWNPEREECLHTLQGHTNRVYSLQFDGIHVVSGSLDTSIRVWDVETGACKHQLMGHQSLISGMELKNNILVSGNADSTVKVWDITTGECLQTLSGPNKHQSAVTCLQFNSKFVITSSDDGTVKLWDLKTGEFIRNLVALESGGSGGVVWRIRASATKLVCAVGSRNGTEETKLLVLDFEAEALNSTNKLQ